MSYLSRILLQLDFLGLPVNFQVNRNNTFKTYIGTLSSVAIIIMITISFAFLLSDLVDGANMQTETSLVKLKHNEGYTFERDELKLAVVLTDVYGELIINTPEATYYHTYFSYCTRQQSGYMECTSSLAQHCDQVDVEFWKVCLVYMQNFDVTEDLILSSYCMSEELKDKIQSQRLQGSHRMSNYTDISIHIEKCNSNSVSNKYQCAPKDELDRLLNNANLAYGYSFYTYDGNIKQLYQQNAEVGLTRIQPSNHKQVYLLYRYSKTITELNLLYFFPSDEYKYAVEFYQDRIETSQQEGDDDVIAEVTLKLDSQMYVHYRTSPSILDLFAKIGGLFSILKLVFSILIQPLQHIQLKLLIYNSLNQNSDIPDPKFSFADFFRSSHIREQIFKRFNKVESHLDLIEVISNPIRIAKQVLDLRGSIQYNDNQRLSYRNQMNIGRDHIDYSISQDEIDVRIQQIKAMNTHTHRQVQSHSVVGLTTYRG